MSNKEKKIANTIRWIGGNPRSNRNEEEVTKKELYLISAETFLRSGVLIRKTHSKGIRGGKRLKTTPNEEKRIEGPSNKEVMTFISINKRSENDNRGSSRLGGFVFPAEKGEESKQRGPPTHKNPVLVARKSWDCKDLGKKQ